MIFIVFYFMIGFWGAGYPYAFFQRNWPIFADEERVKDTLITVFPGLVLGPFIFLAIYFSGYYTYGWLCPGTKDRNS